MSKFIEVTEQDDTGIVINVDCIQLLWESDDGHARMLISVCTGAEAHTFKESYEELKTKLGAI
ncbi:hypothetical protein BHC44_09585 [Snodgrassella alvi]|nr:hypothetical protein BHC44_09585 [Snodgrassella alvi]